MSIAVAQSSGTDVSLVGDVMSRDLLTLGQDTSLVDAAAAMTRRRVGAVLVMDGERLIGVVTERDVLQAVASGDISGQVAAWMTWHPETVGAEETTQQAGVVMIHGGFRHLPVLEDGKPVGIVSIRDLMRVALEDVSPRGV
jgi:CBS domain-containing protein